MGMQRILLRRLLCVLLVLVSLTVPFAAFAQEEEELSREELMALLADTITIPEGQDAQLDDYLVLPEDHVTPETDTFQLLLVGTDNYKEGRRGLSDTMMLVQLDPKTKTIKLASFLRDMYVKIPGHGSTRLNAAYVYGGADLMLQTLKNNFGIEPDAYVEVYFSRMAALFDAIGGVEVNVSKREVTQANLIMRAYNVRMGKRQTDGFIKKSGLQTLTGKQALCFSRIRKIDSDFERTNRQRTVVEAAFHKIMTLSWDQIGELVLDNLDNVNTNLSGEDAIRLIPMALSAKDATFEELHIPIDAGYASKRINGMAVLVPNLKKNVAALDAFLYGPQE
jgi:LCP family protein required for cell wall assembly